MDMDELKTKIENLLPEGFYLMDIKEDIYKAVIRCFIDSEKMIYSEDTSMISKSIQDYEVLDAFYPDGVTLEVTSLGVTTPLTRNFQFRKNIGRLLAIEYKKIATAITQKPN